MPPSMEEYIGQPNFGKQGHVWKLTFVSSVKRSLLDLPNAARICGLRELRSDGSAGWKASCVFEMQKLTIMYNVIFSERTALNLRAP